MSDEEENECLETPEFDFSIQAGVSKRVEVELQGLNEAGEYVPLNLRGYSVAMHVRKSYKSFYPADELTTENGRIVVPEENDSPLIVVYFTSKATRNYPAEAVYDVKIKSPSGDWERILKGSITTFAEVTKID